MWSPSGQFNALLTLFAIFVGVRKASVSTLAAATSKMEQGKEESTKKNATLRRKNAEIEVTLENIENKHDFYFDKLLGIEVMIDAGTLS